YSMKPSELTTLPGDLAKRLHRDHMQLLGISESMRLAHAWNQLQFGRQDSWRRQLYQNRLAELLDENGPPDRAPIQLHDGWAIDRSLSLPHLGRMLEEADRIIAERAGKRLTGQGAYRSFFQDMWIPAEDPLRYPAFLDFITSSELLATVAHYIGSIPALSTTLPTGIRLVESNVLFDEQPDVPKDSQLFHIDYYSLPNVYVLVLLEDTTIENGPWTFLPRSTSQRVAEKLGYWKSGRGYRLTDEEVYSVADRSEVIEFCYPRGTVLFIESSGCMHYGSRRSVKPRFQLMVGYTGACRTDFSESFMSPQTYPVRDGDSLLRRLVLQKNLLPEA
ncbi:MAG: hypothetical protein ACK44Q_17405, partial [Pirellulaceae bacterium]